MIDQNSCSDTIYTTAYRAIKPDKIITLTVLTLWLLNLRLSLEI